MNLTRYILLFYCLLLFTASMSMLEVLQEAMEKPGKAMALLSKLRPIKIYRRRPSKTVASIYSACGVGAL